MECSGEQGNEFSGSAICWEFVELLLDWQLHRACVVVFGACQYVKHRRVRWLSAL
jgi:hypothetical protein